MAVKRLSLESALRGAAEREQFRLVYQPLLELSSRRVVAVEALLRWQHPEFGEVSPAEFVPLLEETGLIGAVGRWVLSRGCLDLHHLRLHHQSELRLAVNLSTRQFVDPDLGGSVEAALSSAGLPSDALELEITESVLMHNLEQARPLLEGFRSDGINIAIDDFGTGYSSLAYLCTLPVSRLKVDRSFVLGMTDGQPREHSVVRATVELGHALGMSVVAEGVEDEGTVQALAALGCDLVQGFHFARPMTVAELTDWLADNGRGSGPQQTSRAVLR